MLQSSGRRVDLSSPFVDASLPDGSRLHVAIPDVTRRQVGAPAGSGIGWHVMFGAPGPWTPVAKSCPGPARVAQARDEIIPAIVAGDPHNPYPKPDPKPPTVEDDDMATAQETAANRPS